MTNGCHYAERPERKCPGRFISEHAGKIGRKLFCFRSCKLRGRRTVVAISCIRNACTVSDRPDVGAPGDAHVGICLKASSFQREPESLDEWVCSISNGADDGPSLKAFTVLQEDAPVRYLAGIHVQANINSACLQLFQCERRERFILQLGQNAIATLQQHNTNWVPA